MISRWIQWRLKWLLTEKAHKMFIIYEHFLNLQIFIDDLYDTSWKLYNLLWTWQRRSQSFYENYNKLQESAVFHDHEAIDTSTNTMNWVSIIIQLQDHISIWQARLEVWYTDTTITRFAYKCR